MTIECYNSDCVHHYDNSLDPRDEGPFCDQLECRETYWVTFDRFEFKLPLEIAQMCSHQGDCGPDIEEAMGMPEVRKELAHIKPAKLRAELREYGAWEEDELKDHDLNLARILWLGAGHILDEVESAKETN